MTTNLKEKEEIKDLSAKLFIAQYAMAFNHCLNSFDDSAKHLIKKHKQLEGMYDLFLDFCIDSNNFIKK